jgi:hypothetical protein
MAGLEEPGRHPTAHEARADETIEGIAVLI